MGVPAEDTVLRRKQVFVLLEGWGSCGAICGLCGSEICNSQDAGDGGRGNDFPCEIHDNAPFYHLFHLFHRVLPRER